MKRLAQCLILMSASAGVVAEPIFHPAGENLTYGPVANFQSLIAHTNNPATGASSFAVERNGGFGFGLAPSLGIGLELGPVDNLTNQLEELSNQLEAFEQNPSQDLANQIQTDFNGFLEEAGEKGYFQLHLGLHPIAPIVWNSADVLGASVVFDMNAAVQAQMSILDSPITYSQLATAEEQLQTKSAAYIKVGAVAEYGLNFSRPIFETPDGTLHAGLRGKVYQVELRKTLTGVAQINDAQQLLEDELDVALTADTGFGVDLGVLWASEFYRVGATFRNVNAPSFSYEPIGKDCTSKTGATQDACFIAESFANEIDLEESWTMDPQVNVEFAVHNASRNWFFAASADVSPVHDPVANELQWATASVGYATRSFLIPGFRLGYRKNLAGSQLSMATVGLSLLKILHLDIAYGLESIKAEELDIPATGNTVPRMLQANLGIDFLF